MSRTLSLTGSSTHCYRPSAKGVIPNFLYYTHGVNKDVAKFISEMFLCDIEQHDNAPIRLSFSGTLQARRYISGI